MPDVRKKFEDAGLDVIGGTPAEFAEVIRTEIPVLGEDHQGGRHQGDE